ncbi:MAG: FAD-dependent oxidoreductase [Bacillota bacterium]|nr:FAD-dependent oxidoreductase [Bacillota bacterium]
MKHVIVGNGPAGMTAALTIRSARPRDEVTVVTADEGAYYSKVREPDLLAGEAEPALLELAAESAIRSAGIELVTGIAVRSLDRGARRVFLEDGRELSYDCLLLSTGASPIVPAVPGMHAGTDPGRPLPTGVFALRTLRDARRLAAAAGRARNAVVVGGGFIGVHVAWALAARGLDVTLVEKMPTLLPGGCDDTASSLVAAHLESRGVRVMLGCALESVACSGGGEAGPCSGGGAGASLQVEVGGTTIPCDLAVLAVGVRPNTALARQARVEVAEGVVTDATMATTVSGVWAAGDVAQTLDLATGRQGMLPLWPLAVAQGRIAGRNMAGLRASYRGGLRINPVHLGPLQVVSLGEIFPAGPWARVLTGPAPGRAPFHGGDHGRGLPAYFRIAFQDDRLVGVLLVGAVEAAGILGSLIARAIRLRAQDEALRLVGAALRTALPARL